MENIKTGKYVELVYDLFEFEGEHPIKMYGFTAEQPDRFVFGMDGGMMLEAFKKAIEGKAKGEAFDLTLAPEDAFGPFNEEWVMEFDRSTFEIDGEFDEERVRVGNTIEMMTETGHRVPGDIIEVGEKVKIDFNHPLAGRRIRFTGHVQEVRDATTEELNPKHGCDCGCDHHHHDHDHDCGCDCDDCHK